MVAAADLAVGVGGGGDGGALEYLAGDQVSHDGVHLFEQLLQVDITLASGELQLSDESVDLVYEQNRPDLFDPRLPQDRVRLQEGKYRI